MDTEHAKVLNQTMADQMADHQKRMRAQADEAGQMLRDYSEQLVRDVFRKEPTATDTKPSPP